MANPTVAAGDQGVAGPITANAGDLPLATVTGTLAGGDFSADLTTALRHSVAKTQKGFGSAVAALKCILKPRTGVLLILVLRLTTTVTRT